MSTQLWKIYSALKNQIILISFIRYHAQSQNVTVDMPLSWMCTGAEIVNFFPSQLAHTVVLISDSTNDEVMMTKTLVS